MAFAIIQTGGKQYKVSAGDSLKIEKIKGPKGSGAAGDLKVGDAITFDQVLLTDAAIGTPTIKGATVSATLEKIGHNKTVEVIKYKQKSRYFKKNGHRQPWFQVKINSIA
jgi:large subunit ribosomal protein L21